MCNEKNNSLKAKFKDCALSFFNSYNEKGIVSNLNKDKVCALKALCKCDELFIRKTYKNCL